MSEGIEYNPTGTVDVTFDDKTYHLGRTKGKHLIYFKRRLEQVQDEVRLERERINEELDRAEKEYGDDEKAPEARAEIRRLTEQVRAFNRDPYFMRTAPIVAEMFDQLGDQLPTDIEEWPSWLIGDSSLPGAIILHWQQTPKVSGTPPPT